MSAHFRLGIAQLTSNDNVSQNLKMVGEAYTRAAGLTGENEPAQLVVFPENTLFLRVRSGGALEGPDLKAREWDHLANLVTKTGRPILLTTPLPEAGERFSNATVLIRPGQRPEVVYRKIHLFDVDVTGAPPVRESAQFTAGTTPATIEIDGWSFGLTICYDLRFPELFLKYAQKVDVVLVPSAFLVPTGQAHWEILLRARAIEGQFFVAAPAQAGTHRSAQSEGGTRETFGHAMVVDPWGVALAKLGASPGVLVVSLERASIERVRGQIPMAGHRRLC